MYDAALTSRVSTLEYELELVRAKTIPAPPSKSVETTFVFQPGGVAHNNVFTSWSALAAAIALVLGPRWVEFDTSFAPCVIPAGFWDFGPGNDVTFVGSRDGGTTVTLADRCFFINPITRWRRIQVVGSNTTSSNMTITAGSQLITLEEGSTWTTAGTQPILDDTNPAIVRIELNGSSKIVTGTTEVVRANGALGRLSITLYDESEVGQNTIAALAGAVPTLHIESEASTFDPRQAGIAGGVVAWDTKLNTITVRPTGAADEVPRLQTIVNGASGKVEVAMLRGVAGWTFQTALTFPRNTMLRLIGAGDFVIANFPAPAGVSDAPFYMPETAATSTPLILDVVAGATDTVRVLLASAPAVGDDVRLEVTAEVRGSAYTVKSVTPVGPNADVQLDRLILRNYTVASGARLIGLANANSKNVKIVGQGAVIRGKCFRLFEAISAVDCEISGLIFDGDLATGDFMASFDVGSVRCKMTDIRATSHGVGRLSVLACESNESSVYTRCSIDATATAHFGIVETDSTLTVYEDCEVENPSVDGLIISAEGGAPAPNGGAWNIEVRGGFYAKAVLGGIHVADRARNAMITDVSCKYGNVGVYVAASLAGPPIGTKIENSDLAANTGWGLLVNSADVEATNIDVSTDVGTGLQVMGAGSSASIAGLRAVGAFNNGGGFAIGLFDDADVDLSGVKLQSTTNAFQTAVHLDNTSQLRLVNSRLVTAAGVLVQGFLASTATLTNVLFRAAGGSGTGVSFIGTGWVRFGEGCDLSGCNQALDNNPNTCNVSDDGAISGIDTRFTANPGVGVAIPYTGARKTDRLLIERVAGADTSTGSPIITITQGTGYTYTAQAGDTGIYMWRAVG